MLTLYFPYVLVQQLKSLQTVI